MKKPARKNQPLDGSDADGLRLVIPHDPSLDNPVEADTDQVAASVATSSLALHHEGPASAIQELYCELIDRAYPELRQRADQGETEAARWLNQFFTPRRAAWRPLYGTRQAEYGPQRGGRDAAA